MRRIDKLRPLRLPFLVKVDAVQRKAETLPGKSSSMEANDLERPWELGGILIRLPRADHRGIGKTGGEDVVGLDEREGGTDDVAILCLPEVAQEIDPVLLEREL